jgi:hypothetical protein
VLDDNRIQNSLRRDAGVCQRTQVEYVEEEGERHLYQRKENETSALCEPMMLYYRIFIG